MDLSKSDIVIPFGKQSQAILVTVINILARLEVMHEQIIDLSEKLNTPIDESKMFEQISERIAEISTDFLARYGELDDRKNNT